MAARPITSEVQSLGTVDAVRRLVAGVRVISDFKVIDQPTIDTFAQLTRDFNWIHVDPQRAARESPYQSTVAHGLLTLALTATFYEQCFRFPGQKLSLNYGFNRVRFVNAVPTNSRVRGAFQLDDVHTVAQDAIRCTWGVELEIEGQQKPALVAEWLVQMYF